MALTKQDIALFEKEAMNTDNPIQLRRQFADAVGITIEEDKVEEVEETISVSSKVKKPKAKKSKKKKMSKEDLETTKSAIKKHTGKTEAECEEILERYKASQKKAKSRTSKLKKQGKTIKGTDEKTAAAVVETAATKVGKKIKKQVQKAKTPAQKAVRIDKIVREAIKESKNVIKEYSKGIMKQDKSDAKVYLLAMQKEINALLKKYDIYDLPFNDGGMVQGYDIQEGLSGNKAASVGNASYERGGNINIVKLASDRGVGGNSDKIYEIQSELKSDGTQQISLIEKPSNNVMARGEMDEVVNFYNLFTGNREKPYKGYAHGGSTQGYDDRLDESLGVRRGWGEGKKQSYKDRRDESKGMLKSRAHRAYSGVGTMDENVWKHDKGGTTKNAGGYLAIAQGVKQVAPKSADKIDEKLAKQIEEKDFGASTSPSFAKGGKTQGYEYEVLGTDERTKEFQSYLIKNLEEAKNFAKKKWLKDKKVDWEVWGDDMEWRNGVEYKKGGWTPRSGIPKYKRLEEGTLVRVADYYIDDEVGQRAKATETATILSEPSDSEELVMVQYTNAGIDYVPQDILQIYKKGGSLSDVADSPDFRKEALTKKAKKRGLTPEQFMRKVLANPSYYDDRTRHQSQWMHNIGDY